jgi:hypothetical protein
VAAGHEPVHSVEHALDVDPGRIYRCQEHRRPPLAPAGLCRSAS